MIRYFQPVRRNGKVFEMYFRKKFSKFQKVFLLNKYVAKNKNTLIVGVGSVGKTYSLNKFITHHKTLRSKASCLLSISGHTTLSHWIRDPNIVDFYLEFTGYPLSFMPHYGDYHLFIQYCRRLKPVIYLDDAHKLQRSELLAINKVMAVCKVVATARSISACAPSLRSLFDKSTTQIFSLNNNDFADKATSVALALIVCI